MEISSNIFGDSNDENYFPQKLLLTNTRVSKLRKTFANSSLANIKLSKTQLHKIWQSGGFLARLFVPLLKTGLPLIGNVLQPLAKRVLVLLGLTVAPWATDAAIHKKLFGFGTTALVISNEEMNDIMKIIKSLEGSATDVAIHKKMFGCCTTELIISSEEMNAILKIIKSLEGSVLLIKGISEIIKNEGKEQKVETLDIS